MLVEIKKETLNETTKNEILARAMHATSHGSLVKNCLEKTMPFQLFYWGKYPESIYKLYIDGKFSGYGILIEALGKTVFNCYIAPEYRGHKLSRKIMKQVFSGIESTSQILACSKFSNNTRHLGLENRVRLV